MISYHETAAFPVDFREPRALAVDAESQVYVGGDRAVQTLFGATARSSPRSRCKGNRDAWQSARLAPSDSGHSHDVSNAGQLLYVGMEDHVEVYDPGGTRLAVWGSRGPEAIFTSITTTEHEVWVADAGNRLVWRFDAAGHLLEPVGQPDPSQHRAGFLVTTTTSTWPPAPMIWSMSSIRVCCESKATCTMASMKPPGARDRRRWRTSSAAATRPQLAVLPDGRFVTAEKGIPRVKIYSRRGQFQTVVAGPSQLTDTPADLATDRRGRVLVLDGRAAKVRVFEKRL